MEPAYKRRRVARNISPGAELHEQRARNDLRLKSAFESIFEKYGKDFTGIGDEIDLETEKIVVDHGHLFAMKSENDPGREEDLYDELDLECWSERDGPVKSSASNKKSQARLKSKITTYDLTVTESDASSQFTYEPSNLPGGVNRANLMDIMSSSDDELLGVDDRYGESGFTTAKGARYSKLLSQIQPRSSILAQLCRPEISHTLTDDHAIELAWRAPPLPNSPVQRPEDSPSVPFSACGADRERSTSPPGPSLWASAFPSDFPKNTNRGEKSRKSLHQNRLPNNPPASKTKNKRGGTAFPSLDNERSRLLVNQTAEQRPFVLPSSPILTSPTKIMPTTNMPWTNGEDQLLHYLKYDARLPYSQIVQYYSSRSEAEIEDHWFDLQMSRYETLKTSIKHPDSKFSNSSANPVVMSHATTGLKDSKNLSSDKPLISKKSLHDEAIGHIHTDLPTKDAQEEKQRFASVRKKNSLRKKQPHTKGVQDSVNDCVIADGKNGAEITNDMNQINSNQPSLMKSKSSSQSPSNETSHIKKTAKEVSQAKNRSHANVSNKFLVKNKNITTPDTLPSVAQNPESTLISTRTRAKIRAEREPPELLTPTTNPAPKPISPLVRKKAISNSSKKPQLPKPNSDTSQKQSDVPTPGSSISHPLRILSSASPEPSPDITTKSQRRPIQRLNPPKSLASTRASRHSERHPPPESSNSSQTKQKTPPIPPPIKAIKAKPQPKATPEPPPPQHPPQKPLKPTAQTQEIAKPTPFHSPPTTNTKPNPQKSKSKSTKAPSPPSHKPTPTPKPKPKPKPQNPKSHQHQHHPPPLNDLSDDELSLPMKPTITPLTNQKPSPCTLSATLVSPTVLPYRRRSKRL